MYISIVGLTRVMDLITRIKTLAKFEGVKKSELILDEVTAFQKEHTGHGGFVISMEYDSSRKLESISLECTASNLTVSDLLDFSKCSTYDPEVPIKLTYSIIYPRNKKSSDAKAQEECRTLLLNYIKN